MAKGIIKKGFRKLKPSHIVRPFRTKEDIILRDYLAMQRTTLSNERTLFAYIRTSLYLILGGLGLLEVDLFSHLKWIGYLALGISLFLIVHGVVRYIILRRNLKKFYNSIGIEEEKVKV